MMNLSAGFVAVSLACVFIFVTQQFADSAKPKTPVQLDTENFPMCPDNYTICSAPVTYDSIYVDQGPYCVSQGCKFCKPLATEPTKEDLEQFGFVWRHQAHAEMYVSFIRCTAFAKVPECNLQDRMQISNAAVFTSPLDSWSLKLSQHNCKCPGSYSMWGWKQEGYQWKYTFGCNLPQCGEGNNKVCAREYRSATSSANEQKKVGSGNAFQFMCHCSNMTFCDLEAPEVENAKKSIKLTKEQKALDAINYRYDFDEKSGLQMRERKCEPYKIESEKEAKARLKAAKIRPKL